MLPNQSFRWSLSIFTVLGIAAAATHASPLLDEMNAQYRRDYGIQLVADSEVYPVAGPGETIDAKNTGEKNGDMVLYFLRKEFAKYPAELVRLSGVKRIVLCRGLKIGGARMAGVAVEKNASIYVDSTTEVGDESHRRRTLHHEFFHFLDYAQHTEVMHNSAWEAANPPGVYYGSAPPAAKPGAHNWASHPFTGFLSNYSLKAVPEDRAEIFAGLMTNNLTLRLLLQRDQNLATKVRLLKDELGQFCPRMDAAFWGRIAKF
jgi:hypothetical protein